MMFNLLQSLNELQRIWKHKMKTVVLVSTFYLFLEVYCSVKDATKFESAIVSECSEAQHCADCFQKPSCVWCKAKSSCMSAGKQANDKCFGEFIENSDPTLDKIRNIPFSSDSKSKEIIQLQPQQLKLKNIRLGQQYNLTVSFKQAKNYPVDIYFLMDLSNSMVDDKEQLTKLSADIVRTMTNLTSNVTLGFGSFVDKNLNPFVYDESNNAAYSFQHHLSMVSNSFAFGNAVSRAKIVNTYDEPESGFDALVQVMACSNEIGWRNPSRHIILLATDYHSHVAGDGKLGGAFIPNDGACHLNKENRYDLERERDYPSVGQLSRLIQENNKNLILAVTENVVNTYDNLFKRAKGVTVAGLKSDSSNILVLLENQYKSITSAVEMVDNANNKYVRIRYFTKCLGNNFMENNNCTGLSVGSQVNFDVNIEIVGYPENKEDRIQTITIQPRGLNEKLVLEIELLRDCACELVDQTCPDLCCDFEPCVKCHQKNDSATEECIGRLGCGAYNLVSETNPVTAMGVSERECKIVDDTTECVRMFVYGFDVDGTSRKIRYEVEATCPNPFPLLSVSLSLMGAIIGIGLALLLIWRLLLFLYDRAEYAKFVNESANAKWNADNNPLYVGASTSVSNPAFKMSFRK